MTPNNFSEPKESPKVFENK